MNSSYKHLDTPLKIAELTVGQWLAVVGGVVVAFIWGSQIAPLVGAPLAITSAVYIGGIPAVVVFLASQTEVNMPLYARSFVRWRRGAERYAPGAGEVGCGYALHVTAAEQRRARSAVPTLDLSSLWD